MSEQEFLQSLLKKYPKLAPVIEALTAYSQGNPISARCITCNQLLTVSEVEATGGLWVTCPTGCTFYHEQRQLRVPGDTD